MLERLDHREVAVLKSRVLAHERDVRFLRYVVDGASQGVPSAHFGFDARVHDGQSFGEDMIETLVMEHLWHVVDIRHVVHAKHVGLFNMTKERDFRLCGFLQRLVAPAEDDVRRDTRAHELPHSVLCGFGFLLAHDAQHGHEGHVAEGDVGLADTVLELLQCFQEDHALDVTHRAPQFDQTHVGRAFTAVHGDLRHSLNPVLDGVGNVRDDLDGFAEVVASSLSVDDLLVDLARGDVVVACESDVEETLIVAQIEVCLA